MHSFRLAAILWLLQVLPAPAQEMPTLVFRDVIAEVLARNSLIEAARERVHAAEAFRTTAGTIPNPVLTYFIENARLPGRSAPTDLQPERSLYATVPLEFLYQRGSRVRRADDDVRAAAAEFAVARWQVVLDAARAFGRLSLAQAALDAATGLRQGLDDLTDYSAKRVADGAAPEGELIRIRVERDRAAIEETLAQADVDAALAELRPFFPHAPKAARVSMDAIPIGLPPSVLQQRVSAAREQQPEVVAARARVQALRAEESYQGTLAIRQIGAWFGAKNIAGEYSMIAGVSLPLPVFDRNQGERSRAEAERRAAERQLEWVDQTVKARLDGLLQRVDLLYEQLENIPPNLVGRAKESQQIALAAYREGAGSLLQVLDATRAMADARLTFTRLLVAQRESMIDLFAAAGLDSADLLASGASR